MTYPNEIIADCLARFDLLPYQVEQLQAVLTDREVKSAVEEKTVDPFQLIVRAEKRERPPSVAVLSYSLAKKIIQNPRVLPELQETILAHFDAWLEWDEIKKHVQAIQLLPFQQGEERVLQIYPLVSNWFITRFPLFCNHPVLRQEISEVRSLLSYYVSVDPKVEPLRESALGYFKEAFKDKDMVGDPVFSPKFFGVHTGQVMTIRYGAAKYFQSIRYFIKAHLHSSIDEGYSNHPIDPKELFVYKVLEHMGYGPKTHFFYNPRTSKRDSFFIATQDLAFTKRIGKTKSFKMFESCRSDYKTSSESERNAALKSLIILDLISRIFRLFDTLSNFENFGCVTVDEERKKWKLLDFNLTKRKETHFAYECPMISDEFLRGADFFFEEEDDLLSTIFLNSSKKWRCEMGFKAINELLEGRVSQQGKRKMSMPQAMTRAYQEINTYIRQHANSLQLDLNEALKDLEEYFSAIQKNLNWMIQGLQEKRDTFSQQEMNPEEEWRSSWGV